MRIINFQPTAGAEIKLVRRWYVAQGAPEAADQFLLEIDQAVEKLSHSAHRYSVVAQTRSGVPIRRLRLRKFPYMLVYVIDGRDAVQVFAFPHLRRERYWLKRMP